MKPSRRRPDDGFTLVELTVVICVLCCLGGLVFVATSEIHEDTIDATCDSDRRAVESAVQSFLTTQKVSTLPGDDSMDALVEAGFLRRPSELHTVSADGEVLGVGDCFSATPAG